jgi:uncharacterized protein
MTATPVGTATEAAPRTIEQPDTLPADIAAAAGFLAPTWPLADFIAVNPLAGLQDRAFAEAITDAADLLGARTTPDETWLRAAWQHGRITDDDLRAALGRRVPGALQQRPVTLGEHTHEPAGLLLAELHQGIQAPPPRRRARTASEILDPAAAGLLNTHAAQWCAAYLDEGQSAWAMPGRERGFYHAWRRLAPHDLLLPRPVRARLRHLPDHPEQAIADALAALGVPRHARIRYLQAHLAALPGFAAHVRWHGERPDGRIDLSAYLAMRLSTEAAALTDVTDPPGASWAAASRAEEAPPARPSAVHRAQHLLDALGISDADPAQRAALAGLLTRLPLEQRALVWLDAYEGRYRDELVRTLAADRHPEPATTPLAQVVCCIDPRSEGLRRHLEALGSYQTLGFAGFFAVAMHHRDLAGGAARLTQLLAVFTQHGERSLGKCLEVRIGQLARSAVEELDHLVVPARLLVAEHLGQLVVAAEFHQGDEGEEVDGEVGVGVEFAEPARELPGDPFLG